MAPTRPEPNTLKSWVAPVIAVLSVVAIAAVGQYKTEENHAQIKQNTGSIVELRINQREFRTNCRNIEALLEKIDRKISK
jgi:predicted secreted Zn-dependent protease